MFGIIIFCIWYLTIGFIKAMYERTNNTEEWNEIVEILYNKIFPIYYVTKRDCEYILYGLITVYWLVVYISMIPAYCRRILRKVKRFIRIRKANKAIKEAERILGEEV